MQHDLLADKLAGVLGAQQLAHGQIRAAPGRILAPVRAVQRDGLACRRTCTCRLCKHHAKGHLRCHFFTASLSIDMALRDVLKVASRPDVDEQICLTMVSCGPKATSTGCPPVTRP